MKTSPITTFVEIVAPISCLIPIAIGVWAEPLCVTVTVGGDTSFGQRGQETSHKRGRGSEEDEQSRSHELHPKMIGYRRS